MVPIASSDDLATEIEWTLIAASVTPGRSMAGFVAPELAEATDIKMNPALIEALIGNPVIPDAETLPFAAILQWAAAVEGVAEEGSVGR